MLLIGPKVDLTITAAFPYPSGPFEVRVEFFTTELLAGPATWTASACGSALSRSRSWTWMRS